jgi:hypothetical protein
MALTAFKGRAGLSLVSEPAEAGCVLESAVCPITGESSVVKVTQRQV